MDEQLGTEQRRLVEALEHADLSISDLWLRYFALGGDAGVLEVEAYVKGLMTFAPLEHNILAHAVNERLDELASPRAPYRDGG